MKPSSKLCAYLCALVVPGLATAADITWSSPIDSTATLPQAPVAGETLIEAVNVGGPATTTNGINFIAGDTADPANSNVFTVFGAGNSGGSIGVTLGGGDADFTTIGDTHRWATTGAGTTTTFQLTGLTNGTSYRVQLGLYDDRGCCAAREYQFGGGANTTSTFTRGDLVHFSGNFTAAGTTQDIDVNVISGDDSGVSFYTLVELPFVDTDGDGMPDSFEDMFTNTDSAVSDAAGDVDGDGLTNIEEFNNNTNPDLADTDTDGLDDGTEVNGTNATDPNDNDSDDDTILDGTEDANQNGALDAGETDPNTADTDADGLDDGVEDANQNGMIDAGESDPVDNDTDNDGVLDGADGDPLADDDTDADGLSNLEETSGSQNPFGPNDTTDPVDNDSDDDGILDGEEVVAGVDGFITDPNLDDTDADGFTDKQEVDNGSNPNDIGSVPAPNIIWSTAIDSSLVLPIAPGIGETLIEAVNLGGPEQANVNGMTFIAGDESIALSNSDALTVLPDGPFAGAGAPAGASAEFATVLVSHAPLGNVAGPLSTTVTFNGLTVGKTYRIQIGFSDTRGCCSGRAYSFSDDIGIGTTASFTRGDNVHFTGTFVATAGTQAFSIETPGGSQDPGLSFYTLTEIAATGDTDGDGIPDLWEDQFVNSDSAVSDAASNLDGDGLTNLEEFNNNTNPDLADTDSDGLNDDIEVNGTNATDPNDNDSDNDGILDGTEDTNLNGTLDAGETDPNTADTDADGLDDGVEDANQNGTIDPNESDPLDPDTDSDGVQDGDDGDPLADDDSDNDGLLNSVETSGSQNPFGPNDQTDPLEADSDLDGLDDGEELTLGGDGFITNPNNIDTDGDGWRDDEEFLFNQLLGGTPFDPTLDDGAEDPDSDGLTNDEELVALSDPSLLDTDFDGLNDGEEVNTHGSDPTLEDTDGDGLNDFDEVNVHSTDPNDTDSDDDGFTDEQEVTNNSDPNDGGSVPTPNIVWSGPIDSSSTLPIAPSANDTLIEAVNVGGGEVTGVNGMTFAAGNTGATPTNSDAITVLASGDSAAGAPTGASTEFGTVLGSHRWVTQATPATITFTGLEIGKDYRIQVGLSDTRGCCAGRAYTITDDIGIGSTGEFTRNDNVHFTGTFTATAVTQAIIMEIGDGSTDPGLSFYTLTEVGPPVVSLPNITSISIDGSGDVVISLDGASTGLTVEQSQDLGVTDAWAPVTATEGPNTLTVDSADLDPSVDGAEFFRVTDN